jgi:8-oxo-dGTP diphosphatase
LNLPTDRQPWRYSFCPYDGAGLALVPQPEGAPQPTCPRCGFVNYANPKPGVAALVERDGRLLLALRAVAPAKGRWDLPGGFLQAGETAEACLHREIREETGLEVRVVRYLGSFADQYGPRRQPTLNLAFVVAIIQGQPHAASDVAELRWFSPGEIPRPLAFGHQEQILRTWAPCP